MNRRIWKGVLLSLGLMCASARAADGPPIKLTDEAGKWTIDNGLISVVVNQTGGTIGTISSLADGKTTALTGPRGMVFDYDGHNGQQKHQTFGGATATVKLLSSTPDAVEISVANPPTTICPFNVDIHYIFHRGESGFYTYVVYEHHQGMPACVWEQTRAVIWGRRGTDVFTNYVVDDQRKGPFFLKASSTVFDTTWVYEDGIAHSKYETTNFIADDLVHGMAGNGQGIWLIAPSREYVNGGPLRQELSVHQDSPQSPPQNNVVLWMLQGNHFGGPNMEIAADQQWSRFYGPAFVYVNHAPTVDAMWTDAKQKGADEDKKWPYAFVQHADYPLKRGSVSGQVKIEGGQSAKDAWVVLAAPGDTDWCMSASGYEFWTRADASGKFSIDKVRPGKYSLFITGGNQFEDFIKENVEVTAAGANVGSIDWKPITHGKTLWQIGKPDRSTQEFANGMDVRHYINYLIYGEKFPNDVTFTVGKSKEDKDWNFAQWGWYVKQPYWAIKFDEAQAQHGKGTLTFALAAFDYPRGVSVKLNGQEIGKINLKKSGMSAYRCGGQDSLRQTVYLNFDASLIKAGSNEVQLEMIGATQYSKESSASPNQIGAAMYDAIRMEVDPAAAM